VIAVLESTDMVEMAPPPARLWRGTTADGSPILALITLVAEPTGDADADERMQRALEERIVSSALITIPERG
jgi:hypothetical protein